VIYFSLLVRLKGIDPNVTSLASAFTIALTEKPLSLQDADAPPASPFHGGIVPSTPSTANSSSDSLPIHQQIYIQDAVTTASTSSIAIYLVAKELGAEKPTCPEQHAWLGVNLLRIVEMTVKLRQGAGVGLTRGEVDAIWSVGVRRQG